MSAPTAPKAGTWDTCATCGMAVVHKNRTYGWRHSIFGVGDDHLPAPTNHGGAPTPPPAPAADLDALEGWLAQRVAPPVPR